MAHVAFFFCMFVLTFDDLAFTTMLVEANFIPGDLSGKMHQSFQFPVQHPHGHARARPKIGEDDAYGTSLYKQTPFFHLPMFQHATGPLVDSALFLPVAGRRSFPGLLSQLFFPRQHHPENNLITPVRNHHGVEVWCGYSTISVRVDRHQLAFRCRPQMLFLGTCPVTRVTPHFMYFHYDLMDCGNSQTMQGGQLVYSNSLFYTPEPQGLIIRALPLILPIQCFYNRYHYSYKVGYQPQVHEKTFHKSIKSKRVFSLTACNAEWEPLAPEGSFALGEPMFFQATAGFLSPQERLYIDNCFVTPFADPSALPKLDIIHNYGCMLDSKRVGSQSQFCSREGSVLRFSVDAFLFPSIDAKHLFLHCTMTVASSTPKASAKSCTFNTAVSRWEELEASSSVCSCCDSQCEVPELWPTLMSPALRSLVTSSAWTLRDGGKGEGWKEKRGTIPLQAEEAWDHGKVEEEEIMEDSVAERVKFKAPEVSQVVTPQEVKVRSFAMEKEERQNVKEKGPEQQESLQTAVVGERAPPGAAEEKDVDVENTTAEEQWAVVWYEGSGQGTLDAALQHTAEEAVSTTSGRADPVGANIGSEVQPDNVSEGRTEGVQTTAPANMSTTVSPETSNKPTMAGGDQKKAGRTERKLLEIIEAWRLPLVTVGAGTVHLVSVQAEGLEVEALSSVNRAAEMLPSVRIEAETTRPEFEPTEAEAEELAFLQGSREPADWKDDP